MVRSSEFSVTEDDLPLRSFAHLFTGPDVIVYYPQFKEYYSNVLKSIHLPRHHAEVSAIF